MNITEDICRYIEEVLIIAQGSVSEQSSSDDTEGWDSLGNLRIIMFLEENYKIKFKTDEITELNSVQKLTKRIEELSSQA